jgi:hypothetical protein
MHAADVGAQFFSPRKVLPFARRNHIIRQQTTPHSFKEQPAPPVAACHSQVERPGRGFFQLSDQLFDRTRKTKGARQVVSRSQRQDGEWNLSPDKVTRDLRDGSVSARGNYDLMLPSQPFLPIVPAFLEVAHSMAGILQDLAQPCSGILTSTGLRVVNDGELHGN